MKNTFNYRILMKKVQLLGVEFVPGKDLESHVFFLPCTNYFVYLSLADTV